MLEPPNGKVGNTTPIPHTKPYIEEEEEAKQISIKAEKYTDGKISREEFYEIILDHGLALTKRAFNTISDENGGDFKGFKNLKAYIKKKINIIQKFKDKL